MFCKLEMEDFDSDNDLDRIFDEEADDGPLEYADVSGDEAIEDNSHNHEETGGEIAPKPSKDVKVKKPVLNPQPKLNLASLQGPRGLAALNELFKNHKFRGSGYEKEDLSELLKKFEQWSFRLFPKYHFEDSLKRLEALGKKREVQVYLRKIRSGALDDDVVRQVDDDEDEIEAPAAESVVNDPFDDLISQQINQSRFDDLLSEQVAASQAQPSSTLTAEQLARIERNRQMALARKMQKAGAETTMNESIDVSSPQRILSSTPMDFDDSNTSEQF